MTDVFTCWCFGKAANETIIRENAVVSRNECTGFDVRKNFGVRHREKRQRQDNSSEYTEAMQKASEGGTGKKIVELSQAIYAAQTSIDRSASRKPRLLISLRLIKTGSREAI